jgi:hypothetical protein
MNLSMVMVVLGVLSCGEGSVLVEETAGTTSTTLSGTTTSSTATNTEDALLFGISATLHDEFGSIVHVAWEQRVEGEVWVEYAVDADVWRASPKQTLPAGQGEQVLLGVPYEHSLSYRVHLENEKESFVSGGWQIETSDLPDGLPDATLHTLDLTRVDDVTEYVLLSIDEVSAWRTHAIIIDRQGRVVWLRSSEEDGVVFHPRLSLDGQHILLDHNTYWSGSFNNGVGSRVDRLYLDGTILHSYETPGLHHPFTELPDGRIAWGAVDGANETLEIIDEAGVQTSLWDCAPFNSSVGESGYCQSNTLSYRADTDTFLFSMFSSETIIEIDGTTGDSLRWFGHVNGSWDFDPPESAFWWQHGGYVTPAGTLMTSSKEVDGGSETVIREYVINEATQTLEEIWSFGEGEGIYGSEMGEAHRLENGNTLHNYGQGCRLREVTTEGEVVWDVSFNSDFMGRSIGIGDLYSLLGPAK